MVALAHIAIVILTVKCATINAMRISADRKMRIQ